MAMGTVSIVATGPAAAGKSSPLSRLFADLSARPLDDLLRVLGAAPADVESAAPVTVPSPWRVRGGATMLHEGAPVDAVHVVRSGTFKCVRVAEDGYEQVLAFAGPGDVLGFDALCRGHHLSSVVALEDCTVLSLPVRELDDLRRRCPALDHGLQLALSRQLARAAETAEMMAAVAAEVRLARFLVWMSMRMAELGRSPRRLRLSMGRREIASLLGVAHETVSRSFTMLAEVGYLRVDNREVEIVDAAGLQACTRNTRGLTEDTASAGAPARHRNAPRTARVLAAA